MTDPTKNCCSENPTGAISKRSFRIDTSRKDGLLLQIHHTITARNKKSQHFKFNETTFDDTGEQLAAIDHVGNIVVVDFSCLRFWMLPLRLECSFIKFSSYRKNELLIGNLDGSVILIDTGSGASNGNLRGHKEPVSQATFATGEPYCLTVSKTEAIIWNLLSASKHHRLALHSDVGYRQIFFIPVSNKIFACFEDNTVHVWKFKSFVCAKCSLPYQWDNKPVSCFSVTRDGQTIAIGGSSSVVILISVETCRLRKRLQLPKYINSILRLEFVPQPFDGGSNKIISVLSNSGNVLLFDTESSNLIAAVDKAANKPIKNFTCSINGKYLVTLSTAGELNVYNTFALKVAASSPSDFVTNEQIRDMKCDGKLLAKAESKRKPKTMEASNREIRLEKLSMKMEALLDMDRLKQILDEYLEYPESYRSLIWKSILRLPQNHLAYNSLQKKGIHPICEQFNGKISSTSSHFSNALKRLMSCLSYWSPLFSQITYLPNLVSPFLRVYKSNSFVCFEFVATFIVNWCQRWFELFPFPPVNIMSMLENILVEWDEQLFNWLVEHHVTSHLYGWTILQTLFSQVLGQKEWLQLFDHILSNEPAFMVFAVVAYLIVCRSTLLSIDNSKDFEFFFHNQTAVDMRCFLKKIYHIYGRTKDDDLHPRNFLTPFAPLRPGETYQIFNEYPKFIVDKQADHINEMREELTELLEQQSRLARARAEQEKKHALEINRQAQKMQLLDLQKQYQDALKEDESRISQQKKRVNLLKRDLKQRELLMAEEARNRTYDLITQQRTAALQALIHEIDSKRSAEERRLRELEEETLERHQQLLHEKQQMEQQLAVLAEAPIIPVVSKQDQLGVQLDQLTEQLMKIRSKTAQMNEKRDFRKSRKLSEAESLLEKAEFELAQEVAQRHKATWSSQHNLQAMKLTTETKDLQNCIDQMHDTLVRKKLQESWDLIKAAGESKDERKLLQNQLVGLTDILRADTRHEFGSDESSTSTSSAQVLWENSKFNTFHGRDLCGRNTDYYRKQQDAIKSSHDIRQRLLSQQDT